MTGKTRQSILPFFLPMEGCPYACVYCDQRAISGHQQPPAPEQVARDLAAFSGGPGAEAAFYGGSFTCLPRPMQEGYLQAAREAREAGRISGVRISTRPDAVDAEICAWLKQQGVTTVELGAQSYDPDVLAASGRGCGPEHIRSGAAAVRQAGLRLGLQLMTGLPGDTAELDIYSMEQAIADGAELLRIYPLLVLDHTPLARLWQEGRYQPQTLDEAVEVCRDMLALAIAANVPVQRLGLNPSAELEASLLAGPYHPAFGGLVKEALMAAQIRALLKDLSPQRPALLRFPRRELPLVFGDQRRTMLKLGQDYPLLALAPDDELAEGTLRLERGGGGRELSREAFCAEYAGQVKTHITHLTCFDKLGYNK